MESQSASQCASVLIGLFDRQRDLFDALLDILRSERQALLEADSRKLDIATTSKNEVLGQIESLGENLAAVVEDKTRGRSEGLERLMAWCDSDGQAQKSFEASAAVLIECTRLNQQNAHLVRQRLEFTRRALDVLHGAGTQSIIYGPDGQTGKETSSRLLAQG